eukprot:366391-Chlamydomonas_euryale.AAC.44
MSSKGQGKVPSKLQSGGQEPQRSNQFSIKMEQFVIDKLKERLRINFDGVCSKGEAYRRPKPHVHF